MMRARFLLIVWTIVLLSTRTASAHKPSDSYLRIYGGKDFLTAQWDISLKDLELLIGLDSNEDGEITWGELQESRDAIAAHGMSRLRLAVRGQTCELQVSDLKVNQHSDGNYAVLFLDTDCPGDTEVLTIEYNLLFDVDPTHRGLVLYENQTVNSTHVLSPEKSTLELHTGDAGLWRTLLEYIREGVWHIWIGFDHILFLLTLLLPTVYSRSGPAWEPVKNFRPVLRSVLKIVTVFTVAHSITLWLAVMEYVTLPSRLIESVIAFSIIVTSLNNLWPILRLSGWVIAFGFGLVHGFGFANVLLDLGLSNVTLGVSLLGFNVGVELGQLAIVLVFLPIAFLLKKTSFYRWAVFQFGSVVVALIAGIWLYERVFQAELLGF